MPDNRYSVDYHLILVIYYADELPPPPEIAMLWTSLAELGKRRASIGVFREGDRTHPFYKKGKLGTSELSDVIMAAGDSLLSAGGAAHRADAGNAVLDLDVSFHFTRNDGSYGQRLPPRLSLSLSGQVIEQLGKDRVLKILRQFLTTADKHGPRCGLVDLAIPTDAYAGMVYGTAWPATAPLARWVDQENWLWSISQKRDRVRGVYWGNYFGPEILLRLGGKEAFVEKFTSVARSHDGTPDAQCWSFANGVFVSLCLNPQDCRPGLPLGIDFAAQRNLQWLVRELGPAGVLNPW